MNGPGNNGNYCDTCNPNEGCMYCGDCSVCVTVNPISGMCSYHESIYWQGSSTCSECGHTLHLGYTCDAQDYTDCRVCDGVDPSCRVCGGNGWYYYTCGCFEGV